MQKIQTPTAPPANTFQVPRGGGGGREGEGKGKGGGREGRGRGGGGGLSMEASNLDLETNRFTFWSPIIIYLSPDSVCHRAQSPEPFFPVVLKF